MTYDYACRSCGNCFEAEQRITAPALVDCPSCKRPSLVRQASGGAAVVLRGPRWARDLYSAPAAGTST